jgi:hypothetical protein
MFDSKKITLKLIETQIIKMTMVDGIDLDENDAKEAIFEAVRLAGGKKYTVLLDANVTGDISHKARDEFAKSKYRLAVAIVTSSLANKLLGNFFIKFHKPLSSSRIFSDEPSAIEWLRTIIAKEQVAPTN